MATETTYNIVKVEELRVISTAAGNDHIIINDVDSVPLETKKITVENFAYAIKDYVLPIASAEILGGIRVGQGLTINPATGVLSNDIYALNDLNDVQVVNPVPNQVLIYDGTKWTNNDNESILGVNAGDGLSGGGTGNTVTLNVNPGQGIQIREDAVSTNNGLGLTYSEGRNQVDIGSGLTFFGNQVNVNVGQGIIINDTGVSVNPGRGLHFVGSTVAVDIGTGLIFADNVVEVNLTLQDLKNVEITTPSNGQGLAYEDGKWVNTEISSDWTETDISSPRYVHNKPRIKAINGDLGDNGSMTITTDAAPNICDGPFILSAEANPVNGDGDPVIGIFEFTWQKSNNNGVSWEALSFSRATDISYQRETDIEIDNHTSSDIYRLHVRFEDLYAKELVAVSANIIPVLGLTSSITTQPSELDLTSATTGTFSVATDAPNPRYQWQINNVDITGPNTPDLGYTFANWDTDTLSVKRDDAKAVTVSVQVDILNDSFCSPEIFSDPVILQGPAGGNDGSSSSKSGQTFISVANSGPTYGNPCSSPGTVTANTPEYTTTIIGAQPAGCNTGDEHYEPWTCYCIYTYSTYYK